MLTLNGKDHPEIQQTKDICNMINNEMNHSELCIQCHNICQDTLFNYCLTQGRKHAHPTHVKLMLDCIQLCEVTADFITRESNYHVKLCEICADVCEKCAQSCEKLNDATMLNCADICNKCAAQCRNMKNQSF